MLTKEDLSAIIREELQLPHGYVLNGQVRPAFVPGWDSVGWMQIIAAIELRLGREIPLDGLDHVVVVDDLFAVLESIGEPGQGAS